MEQFKNNEIKAVIVIPTFNNCYAISSVIEKALLTGLPVLVINDGSTDGTRDILSKFLVSRIDHEENYGKGIAILSASEWAEQKGYSHIITLDADGQHNPADITGFLDTLRKNPWTVVLGNRLFKKDETSGSSIFGRSFSNFWVKISTGKTVTDSQSGFRAYPVQALRKIKCKGKRYEFEVEILVRSIWAGLSVRSVDISIDYSEETVNSSHFRAFWDNARISAIYSLLVIRNFIPWPHKKTFADVNPDSESLSFRNLKRSFKILLTESSSAKDLAYASSLGIFLGTFPLIACHSIVILFFATRLKLNRFVAFNIQIICAPPFVPALAIETGHFLLHGRFLTELSKKTIVQEAPQRLFEYFIGSLLVGPVLALFIGGIVFLIALSYHRLVSHRLECSA